MQNVEWDDWQREILEADGHILLCTGRQVGKTLTFAAKASERMIKERDTKIIAVSLTEDQAFLMRAMVEDYIKRNYPTYLRVKKKDKPTKNRIKLSNGSEYIVRPVGNHGNAVRGFTANVLIVDEAAYMPELMWLAAKPTLLTTGGDIWLCSTPHGKEGYFYEAFQNKQNRYKVFHISSEEVIHNRPISKSWSAEKRKAAIRLLEEEKNDMSDLRYAQEYRGEFIDELRRYFSDELIERACVLKRPEVLQKNADYYLGVDIARMGGDESTFEIIKKVSPENLIQVENIITKKTLTTETEQKIIELNRQYDKLKKIYIDAGAGSLGVGVFDHLLQNNETKRKVEAINNRARPLDRDEKSKTKILKEDLYDNLRALLQKGHIKLLDDESLKLSLRSIQYEYMMTNKGLSKLRIFGNHAHVVEGLIRAVICSKEKTLSIWVRSIRVG